MATPLQDSSSDMRLSTKKKRRRRMRWQLYKAGFIAAAAAHTFAISTTALIPNGGGVRRRPPMALRSSYEEQLAAFTQQSSLPDEPYPRYPLEDSSDQVGEPSQDYVSSSPDTPFPPTTSTASSRNNIASIPDITENDLSFFQEYHARQKPVSQVSYTNFSTALDFDTFVGDTNGADVDVDSYDDPPLPPFSTASAAATTQAQPTRLPPFRVPSGQPPKLWTTATAVVAPDDESRSYAFDDSTDDSEDANQDYFFRTSATVSSTEETKTTTMPATNTPQSTTTTNTETTNIITVQVSTLLPPDISIHQAKQAWLDYCWKQGGGIMVPTFAAAKQNSDNDIPNIRRELLVPWGLQQELVDIPNNDDKDVAVVGYRTTRRGPFWQDIVPNSHMAAVEFVAVSDDNNYQYRTRVPPTRMIWKVQFAVQGDGNEQSSIHSQQDDRDDDDDNIDFTGLDYSNFLETRLRYVLSKEAFWKGWTKFQLRSATKNFVSNLETPSNLISIDHTEEMPMGVSPQQALDAWYEYCWRGGGGGATLIPPINFPTSRQRWIVPALLEEEIVSMDYDETCHVIYKVNNPNPLTFPVHYHQGQVRFKQYNTNTPTLLLWNVQVRPYRKFMGYGVQFWTKSSMVVASRNLRRHLEEMQELSVEDPLTSTPSQQSSDQESRIPGMTMPRIPDIFGIREEDEIPAEQRSTVQMKEKSQTSSNRGLSLPKLPKFPSFPNEFRRSEPSVAQRATLQVDSQSESSSAKGFSMPTLPSFPDFSTNPPNIEKSSGRRATSQIQQPQQPSANSGFSLPRLPKLSKFPILKMDVPSATENRMPPPLEQPQIPSTQQKGFALPTFPSFSTSTVGLFSSDKEESTESQVLVGEAAEKWKRDFSLPKIERKEINVNNDSQSSIAESSMPKDESSMLQQGFPPFSFPNFSPTKTNDVASNEALSLQQEESRDKQEKNGGFALPSMPDFAPKSSYRSLTQIKQRQARPEVPVNNDNREPKQVKKNPVARRKTLVLQDKTEDKKVFSLPTMPKFSFIDNDNGGDAKKSASAASPRRKTLIIDQEQQQQEKGSRKKVKGLIPLPEWIDVFNKQDERE